MKRNVILNCCFLELTLTTNIHKNVCTNDMPTTKSKSIINANQTFHKTNMTNLMRVLTYLLDYIIL